MTAIRYKTIRETYKPIDLINKLIINNLYNEGGLKRIIMVRGEIYLEILYNNLELRIKPTILL
jgi:hypothetical protein